MQAKPAAPTTAAGVVAAAKQAAQPAPQSSPVPTATASSGDSAPAAFDMEAYISQYSGNTRIARLLNIADWFPNLKIDALRLAITELKQGFNTAAYAQACKMAGDALGPLGIFDAKWAEETDRKAQQQIDRLEIDLNGYKTNMVRESIRTCHNDMGDFYVRRGDYTNALKSYIRARDYSSSPKHEMALCFNVIKVSLAMGNYSYLQSFLTKAEAIPPEAGQPEPERRVLNSKLKVSNALHQLFSRNYRLAARALLECQVDIGAAFNEVITPADIALIGGLCALATYDRRDLKQKVIDNGPFKSFLELQPDLREAITRFYMCDYAECLGILDRIKADLLMDIYLHDHVAGLLAALREKALIQYFRSYVTVDLTRMAPAFNTTVGDLESELAALIMDGKIQARIDSHNKIMHSRTVNQRADTYETCLRTGDDFVEGSQAMLLRMNIQRQGLVVKAPKADFDGRDRGMMAALGMMGGGMGGLMGMMMGAMGDHRHRRM